MALRADLPATGRILLTYEDYAELPNDRNRYEILGGELVVNPSPNSAHQRACLNLAAMLRSYVRANALGEVFIAPFDVLLGPHDIVQPDVLFVSRSRAAIVRTENIVGAPDLVVEVISPSSRRTDRFVKLQVYARHQVQHYWLVDPKEQRITAYRLDADVSKQVASSEGSGSLSAPPFEALAIPLSEVWY